MVQAFKRAAAVEPSNGTIQKAVTRTEAAVAKAAAKERKMYAAMFSQEPK
jgi:hypothetical protein